MEPSDSSEDELETIFDTLKDDEKLINTNINDESSVNVQSSDKTSSKIDEHFEEGSMLRSSNNSSLESVNFPVTPRVDVTNNSIILSHGQSESTTGGALNSDAGESFSPIATDNSNQEGSGENEPLRLSLNLENIREDHLPQVNNEGSEKQFSNKDQLQESFSNYGDQNIDIQKSRENLSLGAHQEETIICDEEKFNDIKDIENPNCKIPNFQDELTHEFVINANDRELNSPDTQHRHLGTDFGDSPDGEEEIHNETNIDQDVEHENKQGEYALESPKKYTDQVMSLEVRASPRSNFSATENNISAKLYENSTPKNELANDIPVGSMGYSEDESPNQEISHDKGLNLDLEGSIQKPNESSNNEADNNYLHDTKLMSDNLTSIQDDPSIQQENDSNELLMGSLIYSTDSNTNYKISPSGDVNLEISSLSPKDNISQNDLNIRDQDKLRESLNPTPLMEDNITMPGTMVQEEFQHKSPGYNNDYDPDIPGSEITMKPPKEENSNSINTGSEKKEETDLNQVNENLGISLPQEVRLEGLKFNDISNEERNKESAKNQPVLQKEYAEEREEPKPKTSVRSLITRALENSPETIVQRSGTKNVEPITAKQNTLEDNRNKGTENWSRKPSFQNLAPYANGATDAPCSMAATISGLVLPRLK